ncbi:MAG: hypothetical protein IJ703_09705 [Eubacterium sp.]|nr:hypothetical protein [Eubacterium sp.]
MVEAIRKDRIYKYRRAQLNKRFLRAAAAALLSIQLCQTVVEIFTINIKKFCKTINSVRELLERRFIIRTYDEIICLSIERCAEEERYEEFEEPGFKVHMEE